MSSGGPVGGRSGVGGSSGLAGVAFIALAAMLWGTAGIASRLLFEAGDTHPLLVGLVRLAMAGPVTLALGMLVGGRFRITKPDIPLLGLLACSQAAYQGLYFGAVARAGVTLSTMIALCSAPILLTLLAGLILGERVGARGLLAFAAAVTGGVLLVGFPGTALKADPAFTVGIAMAIGAALSYAVFALVARVLSPRIGPFMLVGIAFSAGALLLAPIAFAMAGATFRPPTMTEIAGFVWLGLATTALAYVLFFRGMRETTATVSGVVVLAEPLTAAILAWLLFGETLGPAGLVGALLLLAGTVLLVFSGKPAEATGISPTRPR